MHAVHCTATFPSPSLLDLDDGVHEAGLASSSERSHELSTAPDFELGDLDGHMDIERFDAQHAACELKMNDCSACDARVNEASAFVDTERNNASNAIRESNPDAFTAVSEHVCLLDAEFLEKDHPITVTIPVSEDVASVRGRLVEGRVRGRRGNGARARGRVRQKEGTKACDCATGQLADACMVEPENLSDVTVSPDVYEEPVLVCNVSAENFMEEMIVRVQSVWRGCSTRSALRAATLSSHVSVCSEPVKLTSIEVTWTGLHKKRLGSLASHVKFLQWLFRGIQQLAPGAWASRSVPSWAWSVMRLVRRPRFLKCGGGQTLAHSAEFARQKSLADSMLDWYGQYPAILRRLCSNEGPRVFDDFCGGGAQAEGIRRGGGTAFGVDIEDQPAYKCRFSADNFKQANGVDWSVVRRLQKKHSLRYAAASPPCKFYSTARQKGEAKQPPLIDLTRDMLSALFSWWWIENVEGAKSYMRDAVEIDGPFFGLRVFRKRLFEANFKLHVDAAVRAPGDRLRAGCCLGARNRWRTFDEFGRPYLTPCCEGNMFIPIGESPWRCTAAECASAMGVDAGHMPYDRLAQAVPPAYSQWVFSQM